jgi:hypothetical protein
VLTLTIQIMTSYLIAYASVASKEIVLRALS